MRTLTLFSRRYSHNPDIFADLFPERSRAEHDAMTEEKEARFRAMAGTALQPLPGLRTYCAALERRGVRRAAVTNAPRANVRHARCAFQAGSNG